MLGAQVCRAALEESLISRLAVNDGIVYLMAVPYVLVAGIGYVCMKWC
jgi:hypothetical protein